MADTGDKLREYHATLSELERRRAQNKLAYYVPYPKQLEFHTLAKTVREALLLAGNQFGKTIAGGMEAAVHLTGRYPPWWPGRRFVKPTRGWAVGITSESTRDNPQRILLGALGQQGTGAIPADAILETTMGRGIADAVDTVLVRHASGGVSQLSFKAAEKGREKLQGETLDFVWGDEEPPEDIYGELLARIAATGGLLFLTCTPLLGLTGVIRRYLSEPSPDRGYVMASLADAGHFTAEQREQIAAGYPEHEREARTKGVPMLGSGRVFPVAESVIKCEPFEIPGHWARICGIDLGFDHPAAAGFLAHDRDSDTIYLYDGWKAKGATIATMASAIRARGGMPIAWPHDGAVRDRTSGVSFAELFRAEGLDMLKEHATFEEGGYSLEAGLQMMLNRFENGTLKVFSHLESFLEEYRVYHRKNGLVVKENDDLISAARIGLMMIRHASTEAGRTKRRRLPRIADGVGSCPLEHSSIVTTTSGIDPVRLLAGNPEAQRRYIEIHGDRPAQRGPRQARGMDE